jgi:DNA-binding CsgD family transcriptional regulator
MTKPAEGKRLSGNPVGIRVSPNKDSLIARRIRAVELRVQGMTLNEVSKATGVNPRTVRIDIDTVLRERDAATIPLLRALEEERLDLAVRTATAIIEAHPGTELALKAVDRLIRASARRAGLLGLDAPVELNIRSTEVSQADLELEELIREAQARNANTREQLIAQATGNDPDPAAA